MTFYPFTLTPPWSYPVHVKCVLYGTVPGTVLYRQP